MKSNVFLNAALFVVLGSESVYAQSYESSFNAEGELSIQIINNDQNTGLLVVECDDLSQSVLINESVPVTAVACEQVKKITVEGSSFDDEIDLSAVTKNRFLNIKSNLIKGNLGNDNIKGSSFADVIESGVGDDEVYAGTGNDKVDGASGNDRLYGEAGNDKLTGDSGDDKLYGDAGNDNLSGDSGNDLLDGGPGKDKGSVGSGKDKSKNLENDRRSGLPRLPPGFSF